MSFTVSVKSDVPVKYLHANMGVRYWDDGKINGEPDNDDDPQMPLIDGDGWVLKINLETGIIADWPKGVIADTHYKVCDAGIYTLLNDAGEEVVKRDGYVPSMLCPSGDGYGDYVIMKIDGSGQIENWSPDLSFFGAEEE